MPKCSYCKQMYDVPRGLTYVLASGDILYFCSSKCFKNYKLGRKADKRTWIRKKDKKEKAE
jgi:large subunit ribosomal protein L24e